MKLREYDYLKFWKVIRYFIKAKYKIGQADLDMLLFLYSEGYFTKDKFKEFNNLLSWDVKRFERMRMQGWIEVFRKHAGRKKSIYKISDKSVSVLSSMYKMLNGDEIPSTIQANPMFKRNVRYSDKVYRNMITEMNKFIRQQRHQTPE